MESPAGMGNVAFKNPFLDQRANSNLIFSRQGAIQIVLISGCDSNPMSGELKLWQFQYDWINIDFRYLAVAGTFDKA
ncbi:hypothetical protein Plim_0800 [Planctopirus limnophila DSM 3776]|uniref:Uncharacterized protein n=1 Tax=Planctopirus limnophila (strain ATCC 43296 / DSM 3776 / IFAM 1008 / Mu 290) TaxID=521674 RepID=D5SRW1_PLAL2|nr:hypothetical protein Plim_0800 [Planctopirus limnophila DSM 3776]